MHNRLDINKYELFVLYTYKLQKNDEKTITEGHLFLFNKHSLMVVPLLKISMSHANGLKYSKE